MVLLNFPPTSFIKITDSWLIFRLTVPYTTFFLHFLHQPSKTPTADTKARLVTAKQGLVAFDKMVIVK